MGIFLEHLPNRAIRFSFLGFFGRFLALSRITSP